MFEEMTNASALSIKKLPLAKPMLNYLFPEHSEGVIHNSSNVQIAKFENSYLKLPYLQNEQSEIDANIF